MTIHDVRIVELMLGWNWTRIPEDAWSGREVPDDVRGGELEVAR